MGEINKPTTLGVLTFHRALSYGAVLQTYSLINVLEQMGHKVELIDFQGPFMPKLPTGIWSLKKYYGFDKLKKELIFYRFRKKYFKNTSKKYFSVKKIENSNFNLDYIVVGSDQVWNSRITQDSKFIYFLSFFKNRKVSYAASFGTESWNETEKTTKKVKKLLENFNAISIRENSGKEILNNIFKIKSQTVLDPTLIWSDYSRMIKPTKYKNYIFCFKVNYDVLFINKAIEIGAKLNKEVILVGDNLKHPNAISINNPSVEEWISLLYNSDFVFTDSFHGLAFSLNFKKDFIMYNANKERFTRISSLLQLLNIEERVYKSKNDFTENLDPINYEKVDKLLNNLKINSEKFLKKEIS